MVLAVVLQLRSDSWRKDQQREVEVGMSVEVVLEVVLPAIDQED